MRTREWTDSSGQRVVLSEVGGQMRVSIYGEASMKADQGYAMGADAPAEFVALLNPAASDQGSGAMTNHPGPIEIAVRSQPFDMPMAQWLRWRIGRKVGRTIYAQLDDLPSDVDVLIGVMDAPMLADDAVRAHNLSLARLDRTDQEQRS